MQVEITVTLYLTYDPVLGSRRPGPFVKIRKAPTPRNLRSKCYDEIEFCRIVNTVTCCGVCAASLTVGRVVVAVCLPSATYRFLSLVHLDLTLKLIGCDRSSMSISSLPQKSVTDNNYVQCRIYYKASTGINDGTNPQG